MERKRRRQLLILMLLVLLVSGALVVLTPTWGTGDPPGEAAVRTDDFEHAIQDPPETENRPDGSNPRLLPTPPPAGSRVDSLPTVIRVEVPGEYVGSGKGHVACMRHGSSPFVQHCEQQVEIAETPALVIRGVQPGPKSLAMTWRRDDCVRVAFLDVTAVEGEIVDAGIFTVDSSRITLRLDAAEPLPEKAHVDVVAFVTQLENRRRLLPCRFRANVGETLEMRGVAAGWLRVHAQARSKENLPLPIEARFSADYDGESLRVELVLKRRPPITGATVSVNVPPPGKLDPGAKDARLALVRNGVVRMATPRPVRLGHDVEIPGTAPGEYCVFAFSRRARFESAPITVSGDGVFPVTAGRWTGGTGPTVTVLSAVGEPVPGAIVILRHDPSVTDGSPALLFEKTDRDGRVSLPALPALEDMSVLTRHAGRIYSPVRVDWREGPRLIEFALAPAKGSRKDQD